MNVIKPETLRRLSHDSINLVDVLLLNVESIWPHALAKGALTADQFDHLGRPLRAMRKLLEDVSTLAQCDEPEALGWESANWKDLLADKLAAWDRRHPGLVKFDVQEADFNGRCCPVLVSRAAGNLLWLAENFCTLPVEVRLELDNNDGGPFVKCTWQYQFSPAVSIGPSFAEFLPFYAMKPKESLSLEETTGLTLMTVKNVIEAHKGTIRYHNTGPTVITWMCRKA